MNTCFSVTYFIRNGMSSKKGHSKIGKIWKKHGNQLSSKLTKKFWLLATFEPNDKKELESSEKRIILQTYRCWC